VGPSGGVVSIGSFYEFYAGKVAGCELTTDERKHRICTQRVTRELIFHDTPRTMSGRWGSASKRHINGHGDCGLNNAYALRRGLITSEYSPGAPQGNTLSRGYGGSGHDSLEVPHFSPYVPDANGNMPTPPPTIFVEPQHGKLWGQYGAGHRKCENTGSSEDRVESQAACQESALRAGTDWYSFSSTPLKCFTSATCNSPITGTTWPWKIFSLHAPTPPPTPSPAAA